MGKYDSLVTTVKYDNRPIVVDEDSDYRTLFGPAMYCRDADPNAPLFIDIMQLYKSGTGFGLGAKTIMDGAEIIDTPHKHSCPEIFVFCGTNVDDPSDLGGEVEFWIGEGEEAERFIITEPTFVYLPPNVVHQPTWAKEIRSNIICMNILLEPDMNIETVNVYPPDYEGPERYRDRITK